MEAPTQVLAPEPDLQQMSRIAQLIFGLYMVALNIFIIYMLIKIWPDKIPPVDTAETLTIGRVPYILSLEVRFLLIAVLSGALGSYIHAATSFVDYLGNRKFVKSWTWWYLLRPFIGVALALLVYFAVRGGLISATTGASGLSPYGVAAIAGMAGLFSKQATDKLREVFETLFKTEHPPDRSDSLAH
jgi:hypothetical protein